MYRRYADRANMADISTATYTSPSDFPILWWHTYRTRASWQTSTYVLPDSMSYLDSTREDYIALIGYPARDTKHFADGRTEEALGGVLFSAVSMAVLARELGVQVIPVATFGCDIAKPARDVLSAAGCRLDAIRVVDEPTQHSEINFTSDNDRWERITGVLPPLGFDDVASWLTGAALAVNFITGTEIDIETMRLVRDHTLRAEGGPIIADFHTLALATLPDGRRIPHRRRDWSAWFGLCDVVQMNQDEAQTIAGRELLEPDDCVAFARELLHLGPEAVVITLAQQGAVGAQRSESGFETCKAGPYTPPEIVDTVGCGDVFHSALTLGWVRYGNLEPALHVATVAAGLHAGYAGLEGVSILEQTWSEAARHYRV
jgi:sugar/nucleoside kinase (ribokinase family)